MADFHTFPIGASALDLQGASCQSNREAWCPVLDEFQSNSKLSASEGTAQSIQKHQTRGQLLARDRIALLLDPDSPFLELCPFAGFGIDDSSPCASLVTGIGSVSGRPCLVLAHIPTLSGGAWNECTVLKQNRVTEIASENDLPIVALVQSAGVFLPQQFRVFHKGGQIFRDLAIRTQNQKPSCAVVFGSSTAGGAYHPALSDYTIFVENQAQVFLGGPPLVKMATGEVVDAEELGGAQVHGTLTGLADQIAVDEFDAIGKARNWVATLDDRRTGFGALRPPLAPRYPIDDLLAIVNPDIRKPFDMREVVLRLLDDSRISYFKPQYGRNLVTAWGSIMGKCCKREDIAI
jgi:acetyl-CoA carboxylase carboxyltransferase component